MRRLFVLFVVPSTLLLAGRGDAEVIERVVAKVNGQIITLSDFQQRQITAAQAAHVEPGNVAQFLRQNNARILQEAVDDILILQKAEDQGMHMRGEVIDEVIASIKKDNNITSEEQFQDALAREGLTLSELRTNIEHSYTRRMVLQRDIEPRIAVSEDELRSEYEKRKAEFTKPASVSLQEILVSEEEGGLALARAVVARARAGEDFQALARTYSTAASKANGGDIGEISEPDMDKALQKLTSELAVGAVSDPAPVEKGYRILKVTAKTAQSVTPFEAAKDKLRDEIMMSRFQKEYDTYMADLRKTAQIELRVREVPLRLTGPIPEGSLLETLEPAGPSLGGTPGAAGGAAAPGTASPAAAPATKPAASGDEEISTSPQAAPEHIAPPPAPETPKDAKPPGR